MGVMFQVVDKLNDELIKKAFRLPPAVTDTAVFRLYYKLSIWLVGVYSMFHFYLTINSSISCIGSSGSDHTKYYAKAIDDYCWTAGTYSLSRLDGSKNDSIYPGVRGETGQQSDKIVFHHYYKWMYFFILIKIVLLYLPRSCWRHIENGLMKKLSEKTREVIFVDDDDVKKELDKLAGYFFSNIGNHARYAYGLVLCEALNVVVVSILLFLWDFLTGHELSLRASASTLTILTTASSERDDPLTEIFPILAKCKFNDYGSSGDIQTHDFLCVLPINVVNERAAVFFWYYFMVLIAVGCTQVIVRMLIIVSKLLQTTLLCNLSPMTAQHDIELIIKHSSYPDWFIIHQYGLNIEPAVYRQFLQRFVAKLREKRDQYEN